MSDAERERRGRALLALSATRSGPYRVAADVEGNVEINIRLYFDLFLGNLFEILPNELPFL